MLIHRTEPRYLPDRYIGLVTTPHPTDKGWVTATLSVHDGDREIEIEALEAEMTPDGALSEAVKLAAGQKTPITDVLVFDHETGRWAG